VRVVTKNNPLLIFQVRLEPNIVRSVLKNFTPGIR